MNQDSEITLVTPDEILAWCVDYIARVTKTTKSNIDGSASIDAYGVDSAQAVDLLTDLEEMLDLSEELPTDLFFESDNLKEAASAVAKIANDQRKAA